MLISLDKKVNISQELAHMLKSEKWWLEKRQAENNVFQGRCVRDTSKSAVCLLNTETMANRFIGLLNWLLNWKCSNLSSAFNFVNDKNLWQYLLKPARKIVLHENEFAFNMEKVKTTRWIWHCFHAELKYQIIRTIFFALKFTKFQFCWSNNLFV